MQIYCQFLLNLAVAGHCVWLMTELMTVHILSGEKSKMIPIYHCGRVHKCPLFLWIGPSARTQVGSFLSFFAWQRRVTPSIRRSLLISRAAGAERESGFSEMTSLKHMLWLLNEHILCTSSCIYHLLGYTFKKRSVSSLTRHAISSSPNRGLCWKKKKTNRKSEGKKPLVINWLQPVHFEVRFSKRKTKPAADSIEELFGSWGTFCMHCYGLLSTYI